MFVYQVCERQYSATISGCHKNNYSCLAVCHLVDVQECWIRRLNGVVHNQIFHLNQNALPTKAICTWWKSAIFFLLKSIHNEALCIRGTTRDLHLLAIVQRVLLKRVQVIPCCTGHSTEGWFFIVRTHRKRTVWHMTSYELVTWYPTWIACGDAVCGATCCTHWRKHTLWVGSSGLSFDE